MNNIFEAMMLLCFGFAWPMSIYKSIKSRTSKGKSLSFLIILLVGYIFGIINKCLNGVDYVVYFYALNFVLVAIDTGLYVRNTRLDAKLQVNADLKSDPNIQVDDNL